MIKSSLRSAGMTECLINFKYMVFGQPNPMDGKYCLSWQAGRSINLVLLVLVVASTGRLAPTITLVLLCYRSFWFHPEIAGSVLLLLLLLLLFSPWGQTQAQMFSFGSHSVLPEDFINPAHVRFLGSTKHLSIPAAPLAPPRQALLLTSVWGCCRCPSPGQPAQESTPLCRRDEATARAKFTLWGV